MVASALLFQALFTVCISDNPSKGSRTDCRIMITDMSKTASTHGACITQANELLAQVIRTTKKAFPKLKVHGAATYCGGNQEYVDAVTSLIKSGYERSGYTYKEQRF